MATFHILQAGVGNAHRNLMRREWVANAIRISVGVTVSLPCPARPQAWHPSQLEVLRVGASHEVEAALGEEGQRM